MTIFLDLLEKILPLYGLIVIGYVAGKWLRLSKDMVGRLLLYIIAPVVFFNGIYTTPLNAATLSLPLLFFACCTLICLLSLAMARRVWKDPATGHIFAFMSGESNVGYFGLPVAVALFGSGMSGIAILCMLGFSIYESTVGYYIAARGKHSVLQSIKKFLTLPTLYALLLGLLLNVVDVQLGGFYADAAAGFKVIFTVLGMMLIGIAVANIKEWKIDRKFTGMGFATKFAVWPLVVGAIIYFDTAFLHFYGVEIHKVMFLMSIVPVAASTVVFATVLKAHPEKVAAVVLASSAFALLYVPLMVALFL